jgi:hypothetical protein
LSNNSWGFTLQDPSLDAYSKVQSQALQDEIRHYGAPNETATGDQTVITYGARVDFTQPADTYQTKLLYTVLANP